MNSGVPVIPGMMEPEADPDILAREAEKIGYPVIIKAAAGGGGKGMRVVRSPADFREACVSASREAKSAFGNGDIYLEKYIERPRHVEFQILADTHGNVIHLLERECSIQRRHQKIIEETPSPAMTPCAQEEDGRGSGGSGQGRGLRECRNRGVPARQHRQLLFPRGQHPPPGGAPHHRDDHRHRPGAPADRDRSGKPFKALPGRYRGPGPCHRMPDLCGRSLECLHAVTGQDPFCQGAQGPGNQERQRQYTRAIPCRWSTTPSSPS